MMYISELYGLDIYNDQAKFIGKVNDVIINLETGTVVRLTTEPLRTVSKEKARSVLKEKSILYKNVSAVGDIVLVGSGSRAKKEDASDKVVLKKRRSLLGRTN